MANKEFKSIDEQVEILKKRGLNISDVDKAKDFLYKNNYYRISGYSLTLRKNDKFYEGVSFQNIIDIYDFDHEMRHVLLKYIEIIEVRVKSIYAYEFTKIYGPTGYLDHNNFDNDSVYNDVMSKAEEQKEKRLPYEAYLKHFIEDLKEDVPFWAYVDLLTISNISFLYSISDEQLKTTVAQALGLYKQSSLLLGKFMHSLTIIRNLCAHGGRLYNRLFEQKPNLSKYEKSFLIQKNGVVDNSHLYGFILVMKRLLKRKEFLEMKTEIQALTKKYPFIEMKYYGFRNDWYLVL